MNTQEFLNTFAHLADAPGGVDRLRELILQLAVRGKLVEQDANDEPAEVLLERIEAEKKRLYEAGEIRKPTNPLPVMEDERPFDTPTGWVWTRLGEFALLINGDRGKNYPSKSDRVESGIPFINAGHLKDGRIGMSDMDFITPKRFDLLSRGKVQDDDLLYCLRGSLGKCAVVHGLEHGAIASSLLIIRLLSQLSSSYLFLVLTSPYGNQLVRKYDNGSAQPNLAGSSVAKYSLPLPPLAEQKRIVARVDELIELCDELETHKSARAEIHGQLHASALDRLTSAEDPADFAANWARVRDNFDLLFDTPDSIDALRQAILELAVRGKLVEQDLEDEPANVLLERTAIERAKLVNENMFRPTKITKILASEVPYQIPTSWKWARLPRVAHEWGQKKPESKFSYIDVSSIDNDNGRIKSGKIEVIAPDNAPSRARKMVKNGTVIYSTVRPYLLNIAIIDKKFHPEAIVSTAFEVLHPYSGISNRYLFHYLRSKPFTDYVESQMKGVAYPAINKAKMMKGIVPVPPTREQKRIVARVDELMKLCDEMEDLIRQRHAKAKRFAEAVVHAAASDEFNDA